MSHVSTIDAKITNLDLLREAVEQVLGLELVEKSTYKWFGRHMGDYPLPEGFTKADLGKCTYAIRVPGSKGGNSQTYEVGVVERKDGKGFTLMYDHWAGGYGLVDALGLKSSEVDKNPSLIGERVMNSYLEAGVKRQVTAIQKIGGRATRTVLQDGRVQYKIQVPDNKVPA